MLGNLGHILIITAFVAAAVSATAYSIHREGGNREWRHFGRGAFWIHALAIVGAVACLYAILFGHHYEYQYAWQHTSNDLPYYFLISAFWEGQEGSFLLWVLWGAVVGVVLIYLLPKWEKPVMFCYCLLQILLVSMLLGVYAGDAKVGQSAFALLRDTSSSEIYLLAPQFVPLDGNGLNPLLQNIWMVIHPPMVFFAFAVSGVPYCLALAGLWTGRLPEALRLGAPWMLASAITCGMGILMGAYWAYETLNFGGYWNWDPVENAVLVPWLFMVATVHGMVLYRRKRKALVTSVALMLGTFILVVYSTYLTRSGVLGDSSVHSFTDLGMSTQLVAFLLILILGAGGLYAYRFRQLPSSAETPMLSLDFWMLMGMILMGLSAFQVIFPTSLPVLNAFMALFGVDSNLAPPADAVAFYSKFQVWFAVGFCLLAGTAQVVYWRKADTWVSLEKELAFPIALSLILAGCAAFLAKTTDISYLALITAAFYTLVVSVQLFYRLVSGMARSSLGGISAHLGMALLFLGFVYSSGHQRVISQNLTINAPDSGLPAHTVQENLLLNRNMTKASQGYDLTYLATHYTLASDPTVLIDKDRVFNTPFGDTKIAKQDLGGSQGMAFGGGDTLKVNTENTYYTIEIQKGGQAFLAHPRMQDNPTMGYIASPDIHHAWLGDVYTHITNFPDPEKMEWDEFQPYELAIGAMADYKGLEVKLQAIRAKQRAVGVSMGPDDLLLEARLLVQDGRQSYEARPLYHIDGLRRVRIYPDEIPALGVKVAIQEINPATGRHTLAFSSSARDWVTIKSIEMPLVGLVWLGGLLILVGMGLSLYHRAVAVTVDNPYQALHLMKTSQRLLLPGGHGSKEASKSLTTS